MSQKKNKRIFLLLCTVPTLVLFCLFTIYPLFDGLYMSFYKWSGLSGKKTFLGLGNYQRLLTDSVVGKTILNDYFLVVVKVIFIMALALLFAVVLTQLKPRGTAFYRFVYFFPNVMPVVTTAILWTFIFSSNMGLLNALLDLVGLGNLQRGWLGDLHTALPCIAVVLIWAGIGLFMLMLMGAISNIPQDIYEAAEIDGAGKWRQFFRITIPLIWPQIKTSVVYIITTTLNEMCIRDRPPPSGPERAHQRPQPRLQRRRGLQNGHHHCRYGVRSRIGIPPGRFGARALPFIDSLLDFFSVFENNK